jgi:AcrR family transcriptional regulator
MNERFIYPVGVARPRPPDRLDALARASLELFSQRGYRRTQVADVAQRLGISPGTIYRYVAGKEGLFELALLRAFGARPRAASLPMRAPSSKALLRQVRGRLQGELQRARIVEFVARAAPPDVGAELRTAIGELYEGLVRNAAVLRLLDKTAPDRPELAELYYSRLRGELMDRLQRYLARRIGEGVLAPVPDVSVAARLVLETAAWFAWHRHGDPDPQPMDAALVRETVIEILARGLLPGGTSP